MDKNVDIISMSWTIPAKDPNTEEIDGLKRAIAEANKHNKLLFGALRESEDALIEDGFYPVGLPQVFKIGSATRTGNLVKTHSGDGRNVQFILPGLEVFMDLDEEVLTLNGSSIATALASGLAALILFCADLVDMDDADSGNSVRGLGRRLREFESMEGAFENMSHKSNEKKFPEVQRFFKFAGQDPTIDDFKSLINSLMSGVSWI